MKAMRIVSVVFLFIAVVLLVVSVARRAALAHNVDRYVRTVEILMGLSATCGRSAMASHGVVDAWGQPIRMIENRNTLTFVSPGVCLSKTNDDIVLNVNLQSGMVEIRYVYGSRHFSSAVFNEKPSP